MSYYADHREKLKAVARANHRKKQPHAPSSEIDRLRQPENRLEACAYGPEKKCVCLECGAILDNLSRHVSACPVRPQSSDAYRERWGYAKSNPLASAAWRQRASESKKSSPAFKAARERSRSAWLANFAARRAEVTAARESGNPIRRDKLREEVLRQRKPRRRPRPDLRREGVTDDLVQEILALDLPIAESAKRARLSQTAFYRRAQRLGWTAQSSKARRRIVNRYVFELRRWLWMQPGPLNLQQILDHHAAEMRAGNALYCDFLPFLPHLKTELENQPEVLKKLTERRTVGNGNGLISGGTPGRLAARIFQLTRRRRRRGREGTRDQDARAAEQLHRRRPDLSWSQIAQKVDPVGFSLNPTTAGNLLRLAVAHRKKRRASRTEQ
jgi:predicted transcriptional regulator